MPSSSRSRFRAISTGVLPVSLTAGDTLEGEEVEEGEGEGAKEGGKSFPPSFVEPLAEPMQATTVGPKVSSALPCALFSAVTSTLLSAPASALHSAPTSPLLFCSHVCSLFYRTRKKPVSWVTPPSNLWSGICAVTRRLLGVPILAWGMRTILPLTRRRWCCL